MALMRKTHFNVTLILLFFVILIEGCSHSNSDEEIYKLRSDVRELESGIDGLKNTIESIENNIDDLKERVDGLEAQVNGYPVIPYRTPSGVHCHNNVCQ